MLIQLPFSFPGKQLQRDGQLIVRTYAHVSPSAQSAQLAGSHQPIVGSLMHRSSVCNTVLRSVRALAENTVSLWKMEMRCRWLRTNVRLRKARIVALLCVAFVASLVCADGMPLNSRFSAKRRLNSRSRALTVCTG